MSKGDDAMGRYARGDAAAFEAVYQEVAPRLETFVRRQVRDKALVEDVIQQTFLQMHSARGTFIVGAEVLPWAFAIARRLAIDSGRKIKTRREEYHEMKDDDDDLVTRAVTAGSIPSGEQWLQAKEVRACLAAAYQKLSEPQRVAFDLVKLEGLSHAQAASILGTTVLGTKLRVHRAFCALRAALGEPPPPPLPRPGSGEGPEGAPGLSLAGGPR